VYQKIALRNLAITLSNFNWFGKRFIILHKMKFSTHHMQQFPSHR